MLENPRRGRQARNFTTNVPKILVLKSSSEQVFSRKLPLGAPESWEIVEKWDVYIDIFVVTKTLQEVNALKEIPGRRDQGIGTLSKDPTSALDSLAY